MRRVIESLGDWLARHETTADIITVWALLLGFAVLAAVKALSWWAIRRSRDRTEVGRALKRQKLAECVLACGMAALYLTSLALYYEWPGTGRVGVWDRMALRVAVFAGIVIAAAFGVRFAVALLRERHRR